MKNYGLYFCLLQMLLLLQMQSMFFWYMQMVSFIALYQINQTVIANIEVNICLLCQRPVTDT